MEIVNELFPSVVSSIFFNGPSDLIEALTSLQDGLFFTTNEEISQKMKKMLETAKFREGLRADNSHLENIFVEIHYRLLEKKNFHLLEIQRSLSGITDELVERTLHQILLDNVNEVGKVQKNF